MKFTKMQAFGNDYVYIDAIHQNITNLPELARFVSDRHFAIGSDGMVLICPSDKGDFRMRMFNPDGSEGEMCGNALRSVGKYVYDHKLTDKTELVIETLGGMQHLNLTVTDGLVSNIRADIGEPRLNTKVIPVNTNLDQFVEQPVEVLDKTFHITAVSWGNPHCAMFVDSVADLDVERYGKTIEHMTSLFPNKTNVTFAEFVKRDYIKIREWERGTGETLACGTGTCATAVACILNGKTEDEVTVKLLGGELIIRWDRDANIIYMTGPAKVVFDGEIDL